MAVYQTRPFKRGDVYYIDFGNAVGSEQTVGRPGVIICNDKHCNAAPTLVVAYATTQGQHANLPTVVRLTTMKRESWVKLTDIATVDKSRCRTYMCTLSETEMSAVDKAIAIQFDIPYGFVEAPTNNAEKEALEKQLQEKEQAEFELTAERDYYKRLYEAALNRFVDGRLNQDLSQPVKRVPTLTPDEPEELVELNTCSAADLKKLNLKDDVILRIIAARPFRRIEDFRYVSGVTELMWQLLKHQITVSPVVEEPPVQEEPPEPETEQLVDLNTASFDVLRSVGFSVNRVLNVISKRPFKKVEDLLGVPGIDRKTYAILSRKVTVSPVVEEPPKLNVNTANAKEIAKALGYSEFTGYLITGYRRKNGPFKSLEDLKNVPRLSKPQYEKCLEVLRV